MRIKHVLSMAVAVFALNAAIAPSDAFAKKGKDKSAESAPAEPGPMQETKLAEMDATFGKVTTLQNDLKTINDELISANDKITEALGLPKGTPVADALADLKTKADGKLELAMDGGKPKLSAADGVPDNVKSAVEATNSAIGSWVKAAETVASLDAQVKELVNSAKALPPKVPDDAKAAGLSPTEIPGVLKKVKSNLKNTEATAGQVTTIANSLKTNLDTVKSLAN